MNKIEATSLKIETDEMGGEVKVIFVDKPAEIEKVYDK